MGLGLVGFALVSPEARSCVFGSFRVWEGEHWQVLVRRGKYWGLVRPVNLRCAKVVYGMHSGLDGNGASRRVALGSRNGTVGKVLGYGGPGWDNPRRAAHWSG